MLAMVEALEGFYGRLNDLEPHRALAYANAAIALDPNDSWAHCALGYIHLKRRSRDMAAFYFRKAIRLNPNEPDHLALCALYHTATGRLVFLALELMDKAELLNPCVPPGTWRIGHMPCMCCDGTARRPICSSGSHRGHIGIPAFLRPAMSGLNGKERLARAWPWHTMRWRSFPWTCSPERAPTLEQAALDGLLEDLRHAGLPAGRRSR